MPYTRVFTLTLVMVAACAPRRIHEEPILSQGDRVPPPTAEIEAARARSDAIAAALAASRDSTTARALAGCEPAICAAIARRELALDMSQEQVLATTGTTADAWTIRTTGGATTMVPRSLHHAPSDAVGEIVMVQLAGNRVTRYSYREGPGIRVVDSPADVTTTGRADALAEMLIREGDDLVARGQLDEALDRYDRADILRPEDPLLDYRIATVLDKQLRPIEALVRYRLFLHRLELERIDALGDAYAKLAEAMAYARERIVVLERNQP